MQIRDVDFDEHLEILEDKDGHVVFLALSDNYNHFLTDVLKVILTDRELDHTLVIVEEHPRRSNAANHKLQRLAARIESLQLGATRKHDLHAFICATPDFNTLKAKYEEETDV